MVRKKHILLILRVSWISPTKQSKIDRNLSRSKETNGSSGEDDEDAKPLPTAAWSEEQLTAFVASKRKNKVDKK